MKKSMKKAVVTLCGAAALIAGQFSAATPAQAAGVDNDPNYQWSVDPLDMFMAQSPNPVLHRSGNWFDAPRSPLDAQAAEARGQALIGPGTPLYVGESICSAAVAGFDAAGRPVAITAGHCGGAGASVMSSDAPATGEIGTVAYSNAALDYSVVLLNARAVVTNSYNGIVVNSLGGGVLPGQQICKQGVGTGYSCGPVLVATPTKIAAQVCASHGDSGGVVLAGDRVVGLISGGLLPMDLSCRTPWQGPLFQPTLSIPFDAVLADLAAVGGIGAGFHL